MVCNLPQFWRLTVVRFTKYFTLRLVFPELPSKENIRCLVDEYFANVHPLRCFGFIHKPSFMQRLDEGLSANHTGNALLYIICALGAK